MKLHLNKIFLSLFLMSAFSVFSQEELKTPLDKYYDERLPELPQNYRAQNYTAEDLMKSLIRMAEGPELRREDIENEFGLRFVKTRRGNDYVARGRYPLGDILSEYSGAPPKSSFILHLDDRVFAPNLQNDTYAKPKICISNNEFIRRLGPKWLRFEFRQSMHVGEKVEYYYLRKFQNHVRRVDVIPNISIDEKSGWDCIRLLSVNYRYDLPRGQELK